MCISQRLRSHNHKMKKPTWIVKALMGKGKLLEYLKEKHPPIPRVSLIDRNQKENQANVGTIQQTESTKLKVVSHVSKSLEKKSGMYKRYGKKTQLKGM